MTAAIHAGAGAAASAASTFRTTLGFGGGGAGTVGFVSGTGLGAVTPNSYRGKSVRELTSAVSYDFFFLIEANVAQTFIRQIIVEDGNGNTVTYNSASATFLNSSPFCQWSWGTGSSRPWVSGDAGEIRRVTVI